jgi:hypothetical protein
MEYEDMPWHWLRGSFMVKRDTQSIACMEENSEIHFDLLSKYLHDAIKLCTHSFARVTVFVYPLLPFLGG